MIDNSTISLKFLAAEAGGSNTQLVIGICSGVGVLTLVLIIYLYIRKRQKKNCRSEDKCCKRKKKNEIFS